MSTQGPDDVNRDAAGRFAPGSTAGTDPAVLNDSSGVVSVERSNGPSGRRYARYLDADKMEHRDDGPAIISEDIIAWCQHGDLERNPDEGPAQILPGGRAQFFTGGDFCQPTPEQVLHAGLVSVERSNGQKVTYYPGDDYAQSVENPDYEMTNQWQLSDVPELRHHFGETSDSWRDPAADAIAENREFGDHIWHTSAGDIS